ncbi:rhoptry-associated protein 1, putative [Plasmodium berghei]|uniref:Rhoptry-associated protein 1 n=2 Tax=Plasmodium berghei TaxID=5821 RepID=A0A509ALK9_PLABA|nr:rhoptry-associated protein 1 [Plasmodium berghei ANKA]SCL95200.1 rhoptry-associated protein 1, putative [Plasmodium berghei]SCM16196.1 rhoptry-associated protein 1, putative [Plasmodium berghei]SCM17992.1 rhoptry-associated protein 1, putative [Plasmodium berghei]SCN26392.1 rhoptry-associated protein 1, putative [Plasmodium berghei]VUC56318.1 rhoptry-associated protein 1 [Plasmodium berghei ANKA]|eukprot:XP_034422120.1 rhoptry-associated protein 1 [Plasmodium berghei ANKA]
MFIKIVSLFILSRLVFQDYSVAFNIRDSNIISNYSHGYNSPGINNDKLGNLNYFTEIFPKMSFLQEDDDVNQNKNGTSNKDSEKQDANSIADSDSLKDRDYALFNGNLIADLKEEEPIDETAEEETINENIDEKNTSTIKYTPDYTPRLKKAMHTLGYDKEFKLAELTTIQSCPNDNFLFDIFPQAIQKFQENDMKYIQTQGDQYVECIKKHKLVGSDNQDLKLNFGNSVNTFGPYKIPQKMITFDLIRLPSNITPVNLANDYYLSESEFPNLHKLNYCLLHPAKLEKLLKRKDIKSYINNTESGSYDNFFKKAMNESIECHVENTLHMILSKLTLFMFFNVNKPDSKNILKKQLYIIKSGLSYRSRKYVDNAYKKVINNFKDYENKIKLIDSNLENITSYYAAHAFGNLCNTYMEKDNIYEANAYLYEHIAPSIKIFSSCIKHLTIYNYIISNLLGQVKHLMSYTPRKPILKDIHFKALLNKFKKPQNVNELPYDPTVKSFALGELTREPIHGLIHSYFEYKKKDLLDIMQKLKLDIFSLANKDLKFPSADLPDYKLFKDIVNKYKKEIKILFQEMNSEYVKLFKMRISAFYQKDFFIYDRVF